VSELRITFAPAGANQLNLHVQGPSLPQTGRYVQRNVLSLDTNTIERFRHSDLNQAETDKLVTEINDWLLDTEMRLLVGTHLSPNADKRLSLVFEVPDETRDTVANLPLELLWYEARERPLILRRDVASLTYLLSKVGRPAEASASRNWPFKVLIVRPNPPDLGGAVPEVAGLRDHIVQQGARFGIGMVQVDVLSSEQTIGRPATWQAIRDHLKLKNDYNVLVYLGHGELAPSSFGGQPIGQLYMDSDDGQGHQPIGAPMIARLLMNYPIPVVVLAGCLTAAQGSGRTGGGDQGVAQALVNSSEAGVHIAVGMRIELQSDAAILFLKSFFDSLLSAGSPGDIDHAVWQGRSELFLAKGPHPPQWAAPAVFRASVREPFIEFLTQASGFLVTPEMDKLRDIRSIFWDSLPQQSLSQGTPELLRLVNTPLVQIEGMLRAEALKQGPLLLPQRVTIGPNQAGDVPVELSGPLAVSLVRGRISIGGDGIKAERITLSQAARDAGFRLLLDAEEPSFFELLSKNGTPLPLPEGVLLQIRVTIADLPPGLHPVTLDIDTISPQAIFWPGDNVVVVPKP
jgi:hypothetical protein